MITRLARDRTAKLAKVIRVGNIKTTDQPLESFDFNGRAAAIWSSQYGHKLTFEAMDMLAILIPHKKTQGISIRYTASLEPSLQGISKFYRFL